MTRSAHQLLLASAGTGKTYRLTSHFIDLLFRGVDPGRILATTFTRKAAGEILDRVLERLMNAARDPQALEGLNDALTGARVSQRDCEEMLARLTRRIDRFKIQTLDAFFVHVAQLFALDLGLPAGWSILEDVDDRMLREEGLSLILDDAERAEWIELLRTLQMSPARRSVHAALESTVNLGRSAYLESLASAWTFIDPGPGFEDEEVARIRAALEALQLPNTKTGRPVKTWVNMAARVMSHLTNGAWKSILSETVIENMKLGKNFASHPIDTTVFEPILRHATHQLLVALREQNKATYTLLDRFERVYSALKDRNSGYRFEDLPAWLAPRDGDGDRDPLSERELDMWYRLDGKIDHLLLDEFQDTAPVQWRILSRIADEILAEGTGERTFFCVGDVKQSIYGWREAEPRLLAGMGERYGLEEETLAKSYRSSWIVLDTVNRVFESIATNPVFDDEVQQEAAVRWNESYETHVSAQERPGAAFLWQAPDKADGEKTELPALRFAADRVAAIMVEAPHCTVGVLLRRGTFLGRMIYLLRERGIRASGEGGNPLTDSAAVLHALSILRFADHPSDSLSAFHVATSPLAARLGLTVTSDESARFEIAREIRDRLAREGYGPFLADFLRRLDDSEYGDWDRKRFSQLVDLAFAWDARSTTRPSEFVEFVYGEKVEDPSSAQVKVMTIHGSKGLEFDAVVLPELNLDPFRPGNPILTDRPDPNGPITAVSRSASRELLESDPLLATLSNANVDRTVTEFLCLLYVAMTRAVHRLDMVVQTPPKTASRALSFARILRNVFEQGAVGEDGLIWKHADGDDPWYEPAGTDAVGSDEDPFRERRPRLAPSTRLRALPRRSPSAQEGGSVVRGAQLLLPRARAAASRGTLVHRFLAEVQWLEDFAADDAALLAIGRRLEHDEALVKEALAEFRAALGRPNLRELLVKHPGAEVWREREFSVVLSGDGGEVLWSGAFDRVVLSADRARIVDFKTDRVEEGGLEAKVAYYRPQLEGYRRVLAQLTGRDPGTIDCTLAFLDVDETLDL